MEAAKKKALFRAKLNAQKKDKRIDSPLVRYNESGQPVCRVCDVVLKSESQWDAHQASRKHHEAINHLKANAANVQKNVNNARPEPAAEATRATPLEHTAKLEEAKSPKPHSSSALPPNFFDNRETKRQKCVAGTGKSLDRNLDKNSGGSVQANVVESLVENDLDGLPGDGLQVKRLEHGRDFIRTQAENKVPETKKQRGALPEGFFDNKEADLLARGIKLVKPDVKDEYKEFEKLIQEDLREVDNRLEEDEIDAAEMIEEAESLEQKTYREKVELLRKKKMELMAARPAKCSRDSVVAGEESRPEESSSDDDDNENFAVDWRAQHL